MKTLLLALALLGASGSTFYAPSVEVIAVDGDTLRIGEMRVRLFGIDAPEIAQEGGPEARERLRKLVAYGTLITCRRTATDRYARVVAKCYTINGEDLGRALVRDGFAFAYRDYSEEYMNDEEFAQANKHGLWAGEFTYPWEYRRSRRRKK